MSVLHCIAMYLYTKLPWYYLLLDATKIRHGDAAPMFDIESTYINAALYLYPGLYYIPCRGLMSDFKTDSMRYLQYAEVRIY